MTINEKLHITTGSLFSLISHNGKCDVCGAEGMVAPGASLFGGTYTYCESCLDKMVEPYHAMVDYIACAGRFPEDININYQFICREILKRLGMSEEQFIKDVADAAESMWREQ